MAGQICAHKFIMNQDMPAPGNEANGLETTRESMRRELTRANTAVGIILGVVLGLAVAVVIAGLHAARNFARAESAEAASKERLWNAYVAQARAVRLIPEAGRRDKILNIVSNAAALEINAALCSEAVATLALPDIEIEQPLRPIPAGIEQVEIDSKLEHYAYGNATGEVLVCSIQDNSNRLYLKAQSLGPGTRLPVRSVVFSPDGSKLAVRFSGGAMVLWDLATQTPLLTSGLEATNFPVAGMTFWPEADKFSFGDADAQGQITLVDLAAKKKISSAIHAGTRPFRFCPGTMTVAIATDSHVELCDYPDEKPRQILEMPTRIYALAWSPDGGRLAAATEDGDIYLWDKTSGGQRVFRGHSEPCVRLTFSPDGSLLASGSRDGTTRFWDVMQGQTLVVATAGLASVFSPDGRRVGFWKPSEGYGIWRLVNPESYTLLACPKSAGAFLSVDLSPSGRWCIATQSKGVRIWDLKNQVSETFIPGTDLQSARITPDETALYVCRAQMLERWPFPTTANGVTIDPSSKQIVPLPDGKGARGIALSLDGKRALVELTDMRFLVINLSTNTPPVFLAGHSRQISLRTPGSPTGAGRFAISPDGRWAATGFGVGPEDHPMVWDTRTGQLLATLPFRSAVVAFSPDGQRLGSAGTATFAIWSTGDWRLLNSFNRDEAGVSHGSLGFIRDSDEIAVTRTRQFAQLRDALTDSAYTDLIAPQLQSVNSLRLSLDGSVMVTASATDKLQVWHLDGLRKQLATLGLDWRTQKPNKLTPVRAQPQRTATVQMTLIFSLAGFFLAALLALASLRRHRAAIAAYLAAETKAAVRNRELEIAKVELLHGQKMQAIGSLATGIAHDFNNLLSVIRMSNKLIGRETKGNTAVQENVDDIEQAVLQGKSVVSSMLGYARNEVEMAGPTDVKRVVEDTVSLLSKEFLSGITLTLELDSDLPKVKVSRGRLEQVLLNLVVNASEAMQGCGKLKITLHRRDIMSLKLYALRPTATKNYLEIAIFDSGPGITPENQLRLFEPFFTTKRSGTKPGTGLGLSLVYAIAQQEGLGLSVESAPEQGATFTIVVPVPPDGPPLTQQVPQA